MTEFSLILQRASLFGLAALVVALALQCVLSSRAPAAWRVWIWRAALLQTALALLPIAPLALAVLPAQAPTNALVVQAPASLPATEIAPAAASPIPAIETMPREAPALSSAPASESNVVEIQLGWRELAVWIYLFGIAVQLLLLLRNARRVRRTTRVCTPIENARLSAIAARLQICHLPRLLQSEGGAPFLVGIFRPTIVLPRGLNLAHLDAVLAHELAHLRRKDLAWNAVLWALQTALWFHPLTFIARRFHALEVESACDELTLQLTPIAPRSYGALLIGALRAPTSPLTAGVNDGFFALQTRLKRLGRTPKAPRRRVRWLFVAVLLVSFGAALPLRLVSRAQTAKTATELSGTVKDQSGSAVAGATVYAMKWHDFGGLPLETVVSDDEGRYQFSEAVSGNKNIVIFADAGARGMGQSYLWQHGKNLRVSNPIVTPPVPVRLLFVEPNGRRAANLSVRVGQMGRDLNERWSVPRSIAGSLQTSTNARGEAVFAALPAGQIAQFYLADHKFYEAKYGLGDVRGGQYAPLASDEAVTVGVSNAWKTIRLVPPILVQGRVITPAGNGVSEVLVWARRINNEEAAGDSNRREMLLAQTRTDANGYYEMDGLRPGTYHFEIPPEKTLARDYLGPIEERHLKNPLNVVNFPLTRGGVIRGVIVQSDSKAPLVGQTVGLRDAKQVYQYQKTDGRGAFQFRAHAGQAFLWVQQGDKKLPVKTAKNKLIVNNVEILTFQDTGKKQLQVVSEAQAAKLTLNATMTDLARGVPFFNPSEIIFLPVKADTTRELTIESTAKPTASTATLIGQVTLPNGAGQSAVVMVRPAADSGFQNTVGKPTDARGRYSIAGLQPGRYKVTALLDDAAKTKWAAPSFNQSLAAGANRADFKLTPGALIEGVVWAKSTHRPLTGVEVLTADPDGDGTIEKSRSNGVFRFRVAPGPVTVRLHTHAPPPPGFALAPSEQFHFDARDGQKLHVVFELPSAPNKTIVKPAKTVTGTVVGPNGRAVAGAAITVEALNERSATMWRGSARSDGKGRFEVPAKLVQNGARLFARDGADANVATARGTVVRGGDEVTLQLETGVYAAISGQLIDKTSGKPIVGARVSCHSPAGQVSNAVTTQQSDAQGRFRFDKLRPFVVSYLQLSKAGYQEGAAGTFVLRKGETKTLKLSLKPLSQTLSGRVLLDDGQSAGAGYVVLTGAQRTPTGADGSFAFAGVTDEKFALAVVSPTQKKVWGRFGRAADVAASRCN